MTVAAIKSELSVLGRFYMWYHQRRNTMLQKIFATLLLLGTLGTIAGCNTMQGLGQDIERGGEKIQEKAAR